MCMQTAAEWSDTIGKSVCVCMHVCMHVCMYVYIQWCLWLLMTENVYVLEMYACMYVCVYTSLSVAIDKWVV
jgi:hypothetical protein